MRGGWGLYLVGFTAGLASASCGALVFVCGENDDCTQYADGVCQAGFGCSYPDPDCDSGLRYSDYARDRAGECVPVDVADGSTGTSPTTAPSSTTEPTGLSGSTGSASTAPDTTDDESTGPPPTDCDGIECSDAGECVLLDGEAHCLCDPGYYRIGLTCLEDPCDTTTCYFVDNNGGDDDNPGTRDEPWQTLDRVVDSELEPGDTVLLRRGVQWPDTFRISSADGTLDANITYGAYGPFADGPPRVDGWSIEDSRFIVVRDQAAYDPTVNNATTITRSERVTFRDNTIVNANTRAFRIDDGSNHIVVMGNHLEGPHTGTMIWISDVDFIMPETTVGDHHWVIDNVVFDPSLTATNGTGIQVQGVSIQDAKVIGNRVSQPGSDAIQVWSGGAAWVVGNVGAEGGPEFPDQAVVVVGNARDGAQITGNIAFGGQRALRLSGAVAPDVHHNTFVQDHPTELVTFSGQTEPMVFVDNLLASDQSPVLSFPAGSLDRVAELDRNWYVPQTVLGDCIVRDDGSEGPWSDWATTTMLDENSTCADGPITADPVAVGTADTWDDDYLQAFVPSAAWERCADPAGALDCDGNRLGLELQPRPAFADNDGRGWEGPLEVRLRYPFVD